MRYLLWTTASTLLILMALVGLRFMASQWFAPNQSGMRGFAVQSHVDVLFIGSSHTRQSYDAQLIEERTQHRVFLIAYSGLDTVTMVPMMREILRSGRAPKLLVLEAYGANLARPPLFQDTRLFFDSPPALKRDLLAQITAPPRTLDKYLDAFALLANRNNETIVAYPLSRLLLPELSHHGSYVNKVVPGLDETQFRKLGRPLSDRVELDVEQRAALHELVSLVRAANVPLVAIESPLPAPVAAHPVMQALEAATRQVFAEAQVPYLDGDEVFPVHEPALFADDNHISRAGRTLFSELVSEWLLRRWPQADGESQ
jgi:hypothetical protein